MRQPKVPTEKIIDLLASGHTVAQICELTDSKKYSIARRIERLRLRHDCNTVTQLVVKLILSGINPTVEQPK